MVERALKTEAERQFQEWQEGGPIRNRQNKITVGWNDAQGKIVPQREKEEANDYRYFPEPDIPPIKVKSQLSASLESGKSKVKIIEIGDLIVLEENLPELPWQRRRRYQLLSLSSADVDILVTNREKGDYFDKIIHKDDRSELATKVASIIINELSETSIHSDYLRKFTELLLSEEISSKIGKELLSEMVKENKAPDEIIKEKGWQQVSDQAEIESIINKVIADRAKVVADYQSGKVAAIGSLIGLVMKESGGQANPKVVREILEDKLKIK